MRCFWGLLVFFCVLNFKFSLAQEEPIEYSFKSILMDDLSSKKAKILIDDIGLDCATALQAFLEGEKHFNFKAIDNRTHNINNYYAYYLNYLLKDLSESNFEKIASDMYAFQNKIFGIRDNMFYHYFYWPDKFNSKKCKNDIETKCSEFKGLKKLLKNNLEFDVVSNVDTAKNTISQSLHSIRTSDNRFGKTINYVINISTAGTLYAAAGPYSSRYYGDTVMAMEFDQRETKIFSVFELLDSEEEYEYSNKQWAADLEDEIKIWSTQGDLNLEIVKTCGTKSNKKNKNIYQNTIYALALIFFEDHGIDLVHYKNDTDWFQIISSENIKNVSYHDILDEGKQWVSKARKTIEDEREEQNFVNQRIVRENIDKLEWMEQEDIEKFIKPEISKREARKK